MTPEFPLADIAGLEDLGAITEVQDGNHGERHPKVGDYVEEGIPFIMAKDLADSFVDLSACSRISEQQARGLRIGFSTAGDVLLTHKGTLGSVALVTEADPFIMLTPQVTSYRTDNSRLLNRFLVYAFREPGFQARMHAVGGQGTRPYIGITAQRRLQIVLPPYDVQARIADILSAYDDLIENNRRRIALLEEAARQLYREWFVRLRFPGHEHTRVTNGVPEGWARKRVDQVTNFLSRGIAPHYDDDADGFVINQKCIRGGRLDLSLARRQSRGFKPERQVQNGDVLVNSTGEGTLGRVAQLLAPVDNCTVDTHVTIARPVPGIGVRYFGQALKECESRFSTMGRGATNQTELSRDQIGAIQILVPQRSLVQQFEEVAGSAFRQVWVLMEQNEKLRAGRDLLLPRLMSGEIAV